jgi:hypothetical protein
VLETPQNWIDELSQALEPDAFTQTPVPLPLTYRMGLPARLAEAGLSLEDVRTDLEGGFVSHRLTGRDGQPYYKLMGGRLDMFVRSVPEEETGGPLAMLQSVKRSDRLLRQGEAAHAKVSFHLGYEQEFADIDEIHEQARRAVDQARRRNAARQRAERLVGHAPRGRGDRGELHARVRRQYSALQLMIELFEQRSEVEGGASAHGIVIDSVAAVEQDRRLICVETHGQQGEFPVGETVEMTGAGRTRRLELVSADDGLLYFAPPETGEILVGLRVRLTFTPRFSLRRESRALQQFLNEQVEGEWEALARMLCLPGTLPTVAGRPPELSYFNPDLNKEQRAAVAGAVAAPYAFFIQGPPGTGKTTVIAEIIRQLVTRGERVLLLAPMHVAVDEALRRVGDADGVLAMRSTYDDSKVHDTVRRYLPQNIVQDFVERARRPDGSRQARWRAEIQRLGVERETHLGVIETRRFLAQAQARRDATTSEFRAWQAQADGMVARLETELHNARRAVRYTQSRLFAARRNADQAAATLASVRENATLSQRFARLFRAGPIAEHARAHRDAVAALRAADMAAAEAGGRHSEATRRHDAATEERRNRRHYYEEACAGANRQVAQTHEDLVAAGERLRSLLGGALSGPAGPLEPTDLSDAELHDRGEKLWARAERLTKYIGLERRWFDISGLADEDSPAERTRLIESMTGDLKQAVNLVCCTTTGFGGDSSIRDSDFDTLIVDEASRVVDSQFLIGARSARRWILVGDEHQLPPYVSPTEEHHLHALTALHMRERGFDLKEAVDRLGTLWREEEKLHRFRTDTVLRAATRLEGRWEEIYRPEFRKARQRLAAQGEDPDQRLLTAMREHLVRSLFERCVTASSPVLRQPLVVQRRMIDPIAAIVRGPVYGGQYESPPPAALAKSGVTPLVTQTMDRPLVFLDTSNQPNFADTLDGTGFLNRLEAEWVAKAARIWDRELAARGERDVTASVLTFYKAQVRQIRRELGHPRYPGFRVLRFQTVDAIDRLQGQESDLVFLSFCRTRRGRPPEDFGLWLQDLRRLNVACTRARRALVLVGHRRTLSRLSGVAEAKPFYDNLFRILDDRPDVARVMSDLRTAR